MQYDLCRHIRTNGRRCQAPSLLDQPFCYFHDRLHLRHQPFRHTEASRAYLVPGQHLELSALEDRESIQVAISVIVNALATGHIETRKATAILYGLQLASANAATLHTQISPREATLTAQTNPDGLALAEPATGEILPYVDEEEDDEDEQEEGSMDTYDA